MNGIHQFLVYAANIILIKHIHTCHKLENTKNVTHYNKVTTVSALNHPSPFPLQHSAHIPLQSSSHSVLMKVGNDSL
jgi:hypothetical protein